MDSVKVHNDVTFFFFLLFNLFLKAFICLDQGDLFDLQIQGKVILDPSED